MKVQPDDKPIRLGGASPRPHVHPHIHGTELAFEEKAAAFMERWGGFSLQRASGEVFGDRPWTLQIESQGVLHGGWRGATAEETIDIADADIRSQTDRVMDWEA